MTRKDWSFPNLANVLAALMKMGKDRALSSQNALLEFSNSLARSSIRLGRYPLKV
jgi:hypothetical protein